MFKFLHQIKTLNIKWHLPAEISSWLKNIVTQILIDKTNSIDFQIISVDFQVDSIASQIRLIDF